MPWNISEVEKHKKGLTDKQKKQWVAIANSALQKCLDEGGDQKTCEVSAIKQANGIVGNSVYHAIKAKMPYNIQIKKHQGEKHLVVPVVMMVEGVHNGSHGALYHPGSELGKIPDAWNGIPVVVHHPEENGYYVSANSPNLIDEKVIGRIYNAKFENGKLKAEAWINENKASQVAPEILQMLRDRKIVDVSVGVFTDDEMVSGNWNGENYVGIARNHRPDHLAILPDEKGACSIEDGGGLGLYSQKESATIYFDEGVYMARIRFSGTESTEWTAPTLQDFGVEGQWEDLSRAERARIASHFLIGSADAETFGELKFPVVNPKTGKLNERALRAVIGGRGAQVKGVSDDERKRARRKAYQLLNSEFNADLEIPDLTNLKEGGGSMKEGVKELLAMAGSVYTENDAEWLEKLDDMHIQILKKLVETGIEAQKKFEEAQKELEELKKKAVTVNKEDLLQALEATISDPAKAERLFAPEMRDQFRYGQKLYNEHRKSLIGHILANQATKVWDEKELEGKSFSDLEKIAGSIKTVVDYSLAGAEMKHDSEEVLMPICVNSMAKKDKEVK